MKKIVKRVEPELEVVELKYIAAEGLHGLCGAMPIVAYKHDGGVYVLICARDENGDVYYGFAELSGLVSASVSIRWHPRSHVTASIGSALENGKDVLLFDDAQEFFNWAMAKC